MKSLAQIGRVFLFFLFFGAHAIFASPFGESGGIQNEGDVPVKILLIFKGGSYEWKDLTRRASHDFPENIQSVQIFRGSNPFYEFDKAPPRKFSVVVIHQDGARQEVSRPGTEVRIKPAWRGKDAQRKPPFKIENRP